MKCCRSTFGTRTGDSFAMSACITGRFEHGVVRAQLYILHYTVMLYLFPASHGFCSLTAGSVGEISAVPGGRHSSVNSGPGSQVHAHCTRGSVAHSRPRGLCVKRHGAPFSGRRRRIHASQLQTCRVTSSLETGHENDGTCRTSKLVQSSKYMLPPTEPIRELHVMDSADWALQQRIKGCAVSRSFGFDVGEALHGLSEPWVTRTLLASLRLHSIFLTCVPLTSLTRSTEHPTSSAASAPWSQRFTRIQTW